MDCFELGNGLKIQCWNDVCLRDYPADNLLLIAFPDLVQCYGWDALKCGLFLNNMLMLIWDSQFNRASSTERWGPQWSFAN